MTQSYRRGRAADFDGMMVASGLAHPHPFHRTPGTPTPFVGREREREQATAGLATQKVVTLTGMAGSGKTALAASVIQEGERLIYWIDLAPGLNDNLDALLWQLAQPLAEHAPLVWRMLHQMHREKWGYSANIRLQIILEAYSKSQIPLNVCIDRVDYELDPAVKSLLIHLCSHTTRQTVPQLRLLVAGRMLPHEIRQYELTPSLPGVSVEAVGQWADGLALKLESGVIRSIHEQTDGLPQAIACLFAALLNDPSTVNLHRIVVRPEIRRFVAHFLSRLDPKDRGFLTYMVKHHLKDDTSLRPGFLNLERYHITTMLPSGKIVISRLLHDFIQYYDVQ